MLKKKYVENLFTEVQKIYAADSVLDLRLLGIYLWTQPEDVEFLEKRGFKPPRRN